MSGDAAVERADPSRPPPRIPPQTLERLAIAAATERAVVCPQAFTFDREHVELLLEKLEGEPCRAWQTPGSCFPDARWERLAIDSADFSGATFGAAAGFTGVQFGDCADFSGASFGLPHSATPDAADGADLAHCRFGHHARFDHTTWHKDADLCFSAFEQGAQFDGLVQHGHLRFRDTTFGPGLYLAVDDADAPHRHIDFSGASIGPGAQIEVRDRRVGIGFDEAALGSWTRIVFTSTSNFRDVSLAGARIGRGLQLHAHEGMVDLRRVRGESLRVIGEARLISLRNAHLDELTLDRVDLASCHWGGASIGRLTLGAGTRFARARVMWVGPSSTRNVLREDRWSTGGDQLPAPGDEGGIWFEMDGVSMAEVEDRYRAIRTALEQGGNGAAGNDFYYAEMQLRRLSRRFSSDRPVPPSAQGVVLQAYWLISGYGLRAWRAVALLLAILTTVALLYHGGMASSAAQPVTFREGLVIAGQQGLSVRPRAGTTLTTGGEALGLLLRVLVPLLLAFAAVALRNRISRHHPWR